MSQLQHYSEVKDKELATSRKRHKGEVKQLHAEIKRLEELLGLRDQSITEKDKELRLAALDTARQVTVRAPHGR